MLKDVQNSSVKSCLSTTYQRRGFFEKFFFTAIIIFKLLRYPQQHTLLLLETGSTESCASI